MQTICVGIGVFEQTICVGMTNYLCRYVLWNARISILSRLLKAFKSFLYY